MVRRMSVDARKAVLSGAIEEARRRGDARVGTEHLLLALLRDPDSLTSRALGVDLEQARDAASDLDRLALAAIGVDVPPSVPSPVMAAGRRPRFTSGARAALVRGIRQTRSERAQQVSERHLLVGLLEAEPPDPAATLIDALGIDREQTLSTLGQVS